MIRRPPAYCLLLVAAALLLCPPAAGAVVLDRIVAIVGQDAITWMELHEKMRAELAPQLKGVSPEEASEALRNAEGEFLQSLIVRSLQIQEAEKAKVAATQEDVDAAIEDIRLKYGLDEQGFRQAIRSEGLEWDIYTEMIWEQLTIRRIVDREVRSRLPERIEAKGSVLYTVGLVVFEQGGEGEDPSVRAGAFFEEITSGAAFEERAFANTGAPPAELTIKGDQLSEPFRNALEGMEPGDVSRPFMAGRGVNVIKLYERRAPQEVEYERLFEERYRNWMKELLDNSYVDVRL